MHEDLVVSAQRGLGPAADRHATLTAAAAQPYRALCASSGASRHPVRAQRDTAFRTEEEETAHGPANYALWLGDRIVGIVGAKKLTIGPQNVLTQAEGYARDPAGGSFDFDGVRCPFLYATNGEVIWFHDVRHGRNRSRGVKHFHTPAALRELLEKDAERALACLGIGTSFSGRRVMARGGAAGVGLSGGLPGVGQANLRCAGG
jgi:hypothetical protein